jgi:hypothetical protein
MKNITVCYLFTKFDKLNSFYQFLKNYKKFRPGLNHNLLICYKLVNVDMIKIFEAKLRKIPHTEYLDTSPLNDYDFGSYYRVCKSYPNKKIFFLNAKSYPIKHNWLKIISKSYKNNSFVGTSASYESQLTSLNLKKFYKIFSFLINFIHLKKRFNSFPNPHIRTSGFLINSNNFIDFYKKKFCKNKLDAWSIESGKDSITNYFKSKKYPLFIVNSDGISFNEKDWKKSNTFNYQKQDKSIISDTHTRKYLKLNHHRRLISQFNTWGE